jgi:hypothetical protein
MRMVLLDASLVLVLVCENDYIFFITRTFFEFIYVIFVIRDLSGTRR